MQPLDLFARDLPEIPGSFQDRDISGCQHHPAMD
jgi:hypothetical protein